MSAPAPTPGRIALYAATPTPDDDYYMDVREAAKALGVGASTLYDAIKAGTLDGIRYVKVGTRIRISRADVRQATGRTV
jgi:excisionase family DNA binding protein